MATSSPFPSPASASSSTLITTPLPPGQPKDIGLGRPTTQRTTPPLHAASAQTRMSDRGFIEPHHSNIPRRTRRKTVPTKDVAQREREEREREEREREEREREEREREKEESERREAQRAKEIETGEKRLATLHILDPSLALHDDTVTQPTTPRDTPNPNDTRMPLHLLSLRLPPTPAPLPPRPLSYPFPFSQIPAGAADSTPASDTPNEKGSGEGVVGTPIKTPAPKGHLTPHSATLPRRHQRMGPVTATRNTNSGISSVPAPNLASGHDRVRARSAVRAGSPTPVSRPGLVRFQPGDDASRRNDRFDWAEGVESSQSRPGSQARRGLRDSSLSARGRWGGDTGLAISNLGADLEDVGDGEWMKPYPERRAREKARREKREKRDRKCLQRLGREGKVEVAFLSEEENGGAVDRVLGMVLDNSEGKGDTVDTVGQRPYVLLRIIDSDSGDDGESESESDSQPLSSAGPSSQSAPESSLKESVSSISQPESSGAGEEGTTSQMKPYPAQSDEDTRATQEIENEPKELRLYLPSDSKASIDGTTALSGEQVHEACAFIETALAQSSSRTTTQPSTASNSKIKKKAVKLQPPQRRVRILTPRSRPEEAMSIALCYQASASTTISASSSSGLSSVSLNSPTLPTLSLDATSTTTEDKVAGAARLIPSASAEERQIRRRSVPVPGPLLGHDADSMEVVEVAVDIEQDDEGPPEPTSLSETPIASSSLSQECTEQSLPNWSQIDDEEAYSAVHLLAMHLLDEGEWLARGKQWEARIASLGLGPETKKPSMSVPQGLLWHKNGRHSLREIGSPEDEDDQEAYGEDGELEDDDEEGSTADGDESGSGGASADSRSVSGGHALLIAGVADDDGDAEVGERGRSHDVRGRGLTGTGANTQWHGVPMPSKFEEPSSAFISSAKGKSKSKSRARSQSAANARREAQQQKQHHHRAQSRAVERRRQREVRRQERAEAALYKGIRMEWRGVLSYEGMQRLVGMWTPRDA